LLVITTFYISLSDRTSGSTGERSLFCQQTSHFHAVGSCEAGATPFSGAGGHFDPGPNGSSTPVEANHPYHLGDLPNLVVDAQGIGRLQTTTSRISLVDSSTTAFDADGTAIIIHANQDQIKREEQPLRLGVAV
jgi:Cu/Zn superoxide dismutase